MPDFHCGIIGDRFYIIKTVRELINGQINTTLSFYDHKDFCCSHVAVRASVAEVMPDFIAKAFVKDFEFLTDIDLGIAISLALSYLEKMVHDVLYGNIVWTKTVTIGAIPVAVIGATP